MRAAFGAAGRPSGLAVDLLSHLPAKRCWADDPATNHKALAPEIVSWLRPDRLVVFDLGGSGSIENGCTFSIVATEEESDTAIMHDN